MKMGRRRLRDWIGMILGMAVIMGCGDGADFSGTARQSSNLEEGLDDGEEELPGDDGPVEPPPEDEVEITPYASLTWHWQCDSAPGAIPEPATDEDVVVAGVGPHTFQTDELLGTPMTFSGELCPPEALPRDLVFVIDTSGSMRDNDPQTGNTCGRLRAIESVINSVPAGVGRFAVVTFDTTANPLSNSTMLWGTADEMKLDLERNGSSYADVVCAANGNTNYTDGLVQARALLETGAVNATKEVYFVSDGQPNGGQDGVLQASQMRNPGIDVAGTQMRVTIATVMLGGNDTVLEDRIASRVDDGMGNLVPLHAYVANTQQLAKALAELSSNEITEANLRYRPIGGSDLDWVDLSIFDHLQGYEFVIDAGAFEWESAPDGIEVLYTYKDAHGNEFAISGQLVLAAGNSSGEALDDGEEGDAQDEMSTDDETTDEEA